MSSASDASGSEPGSSYDSGVAVALDAVGSVTQFLSGVGGSVIAPLPPPPLPPPPPVMNGTADGPAAGGRSAAMTGTDEGRSGDPAAARGAHPGANGHAVHFGSVDGVGDLTLDGDGPHAPHADAHDGGEGDGGDDDEPMLELVDHRPPPAEPALSPDAAAADAAMPGAGMGGQDKGPASSTPPKATAKSPVPRASVRRETCRVCNSRARQASMAVCGFVGQTLKQCGRAYHTDCLTPALMEPPAPPVAWVCPVCVEQGWNLLIREARAAGLKTDIGPSRHQWEVCCTLPTPAPPHPASGSSASPRPQPLPQSVWYYCWKSGPAFFNTWFTQHEIGHRVTLIRTPPGSNIPAPPSSSPPGLNGSAQPVARPPALPPVPTHPTAPTPPAAPAGRTPSKPKLPASSPMPAVTSAAGPGSAIVSGAMTNGAATPPPGRSSLKSPRVSIPLLERLLSPLERSIVGLPPLAPLLTEGGGDGGGEGGGTAVDNAPAMGGAVTASAPEPHAGPLAPASPMVPTVAASPPLGRPRPPRVSGVPRCEMCVRRHVGGCGTASAAPFCVRRPADWDPLLSVARGAKGGRGGGVTSPGTTNAATTDRRVGAAHHASPAAVGVMPGVIGGGDYRPASELWDTSGGGDALQARLGALRGSLRGAAGAGGTVEAAAAATLADFTRAAGVGGSGGRRAMKRDPRRVTPGATAAGAGGGGGHGVGGYSAGASPFHDATTAVAAEALWGTGGGAAGGVPHTVGGRRPREDEGGMAAGAPAPKRLKSMEEAKAFLLGLKELMDGGVLEPEEYKAEKARVLDAMRSNLFG